MTDLLSFKPELRHGSDNAEPATDVPAILRKCIADRIKALNEADAPIFSASELAAHPTVEPLLYALRLLEGAAQQQAREAA